MTVQNKIVLITGAGSGLGRSIADAFLAAGAKVAVCDISAPRLEQVAADMDSAHRGRFLTYHADVADEPAVQGFFEAAVARFGPPDVIVNNAGIVDDFSGSGACATEVWNKVLAVNLTGPFLVTRTAVQHFQRHDKGGVILNIGSVASCHAFTAGTAYTVSKTGLRALTGNTAGFYGSKGIYCIMLMLGAMKTALLEGVDMNRLNGGELSDMRVFQSAQQGKDIYTPTESVAKYCVFLAQDDVAPYANGSCVPFYGNIPET